MALLFTVALSAKGVVQSNPVSIRQPRNLGYSIKPLVNC
jgi:hypothetical protein